MTMKTSFTLTAKTSDGIVGSFVEPRLGMTVGVRQARQRGVGAGRVVKTDAGTRRIGLVEKVSPSSSSRTPPVKEDGPKMPATYCSTVVTFRQVVMMSSGVYSSFLSQRPLQY